MKRLCKSRTNRKICGVCGGVGEYFGVEPVIVRLLFLALAIGLGSGLLVYILAALVMPDAPAGSGYGSQGGDYQEYDTQSNDPPVNQSRYR